MPEISAFCPGCGRTVGMSRQFPETRPLSLDAVLGTLAYVGVLPAVVLVLLPSLKGNRFVRFHSWQSILFAGATVAVAVTLRLLFALFTLLSGIGFLFGALAVGVASLGISFLWLVLMVKAIQGDAYELPWLGGIAARLA